MIFLKPNNLIESFFQLIINSFFRLIISFKKRINLNQKNTFFLNGDFFASLSNYNDLKIVYSSLTKFPEKKMFKKYKKKVWIFHNSDEIFDVKKKKKLDFFQPKKCFSQNLVFKKKIISTYL